MLQATGPLAQRGPDHRRTARRGGPGRGALRLPLPGLPRLYLQGCDRGSLGRGVRPPSRTSALEHSVEPEVAGVSATPPTGGDRGMDLQVPPPLGAYQGLLS